MKGLEIWHRASERPYSLIRLLIISDVSACPLSADEKTTYSYLYDLCVSTAKTVRAMSFFVVFDGLSAEKKHYEFSFKQFHLFS